MSEQTNAAGDPQLRAILRAHLTAPPLRPGFHDELEARLNALPAPERRGSLRLPTLRRPRILALAAVVAVAALVAFVVLPMVQSSSTATAADMLKAMSYAGQRTDAIALDMVIVNKLKEQSSQGDYRYSSSARVRLTLDTRGDVLAESKHIVEWSGQGSGRTRTESTSAYDASSHKATTISHSGGSKQATIVRRPAWQAGLGLDPYFLSGDYSSLAASFRAQLAELDPNTPVRDVTYLGRPAWSAELVERQWWEGNGGKQIPFVVHWRLVVDKETGLLLSVQPNFEVGGEQPPGEMSLRVVGIEVDPGLPDQWQLPSLPKIGKIVTIDPGIRFGTPDTVAERCWPTLPLIAQHVPAGYTLVDVASSPSLVGPDYGSSVPDGSSVVTRRSGRNVFRESNASPIVALARFRRGYGSFTVEVYPKQFGEQVEPGGAGGVKNIEKVTLTGGYLKGSVAETWTGPYDGEGPTLMTTSDRSWVRITGDLTRQELIDVANSMKVYGDVNKPLIPGY